MRENYDFNFIYKLKNTISYFLNWSLEMLIASKVSQDWTEIAAVTAKSDKSQACAQKRKVAHKRNLRRPWSTNMNFLDLIRDGDTF